MLDEYFRFEEVNRLIFELETNPKYYRKNNRLDKVIPSIRDNLALYTFYEAIYKYKVLVDDIYLFKEYIDDLEKLFRKLDSIDDISKGINKILCNLVGVTLNISDFKDEDDKKTVIKDIYDKYIVNGYYIHGFPTVYEKSIFRNGIRTGIYENYYPYMRNVDNIFKKHGIKNIFNKDFSDKSMCFTDDFVMGCYYSSVAPGYFSSFLLSSVFSDDSRAEDYQYNNYSACTKWFKDYLDKNNYSVYEKDMINKVVKNEYKHLNFVAKRISILLIPRRLISKSVYSLESFCKKNNNIYDIVDNILTSREANVRYNGLIDSNDIDILSFYFPMREKNYLNVDIPKTELTELRRTKKKQPLNTYGVVSILIILGSLLISLGIIISIIMIGGV